MRIEGLGELWDTFIEGADIIAAIGILVVALFFIPQIIGLAFSSADPARSVMARAVALGEEFNFYTSAQYAEDILILANKTGELEENGTLPAPLGTAKYLKTAYVTYRCYVQYDLYDEMAICIKLPLPAPSCVYDQYGNDYFFLFMKIEKPERRFLLGYGGG